MSPQPSSAKRPTRKAVLHLEPSRRPDVLRGIDAAKRTLSGGNPAGVIQIVNKLLPIEPDNPQLHLIIAGAAEQLRLHSVVDEAYGNALRLVPDFLPAIVNWAAWLADTLRPVEALDLYRRAIHLARVMPESW